MAEKLDYNLLDDETRECPFKYFETIRQLDRPVYFMPELKAYYVSRYEDVRYIKKHPELFSNDTMKFGARQSADDAVDRARARAGRAAYSAR